MLNPQQVIKSKRGASKPNILVKKKRNESSDNISNISGSSNNVSKIKSKPSKPMSNKNKTPGFLSSGPFKNIDVENENEPLIKTSSRRRPDVDEIIDKNQALVNGALNLINLAINNEEEDEQTPYLDKTAVNDRPSIEPHEDSVAKKKFEPRETPNFRIEEQETVTNNAARSYCDEINEEQSESHSASMAAQCKNEESYSSHPSAAGDVKPARYSRKLEELKRQQAKLDKIKSEKDQLQAFLNYQQELEQEKERRRAEEQMQAEAKYNRMAVVIQKYARVWLAKRTFAAMQEEAHQREKALLYQALNEMRDQIRTCGTDSKEKFVQAAITIQRYVRGIFIRRLLAPYFELYRSINPLVTCLASVHTKLR